MGLMEIGTSKFMPWFWGNFMGLFVLLHLIDAKPLKARLSSLSTGIVHADVAFKLLHQASPVESLI